MHIGTYHIESLQIYFPASLELQEELINAGFKVPKPTPLPIVYANFRGWVSKKPPVTIERLIHPSRYGRSPSDLGWERIIKGGKEAYVIPDEKSLLEVELCGEKRNVCLVIKPENYHIERTSVRRVGPERWSNWVMFYLNIRDVLDLTEKLISKVGLPQDLCERRMLISREVQQSGREETYFCELEKKKGIPVENFSFCMGCFDQIVDYLANEIGDVEIIKKLRLKLNYSPDIGGFAKIGVARIEGKNPQFMFKLASHPREKVIKGILKDEVRGKARGTLNHCLHKDKSHFIMLNSALFLRTLCTINKILKGETPKGQICETCHTRFIEPQWIKEMRNVLKR
ncbi:MAG: PhoI [Candidatus Nezhaarchaeota archaeon]|nr:PhoI [Candidatus Nezhaarchaeota archaeon]MCX8141290.1 PhoI [Candidatus Nezhaarchaeota archaeon]MDW8049556.1 PhoI [Nitrososphaerota archaeon]